MRSVWTSGPAAVVRLFMMKLSTSVPTVPSRKRTSATLVSSPSISAKRWRARSAWMLSISPISIRIISMSWTPPDIMMPPAAARSFRNQGRSVRNDWRK